MQQLRPVPTRLPRQRASYVDPALATCTHVFLRHDAVRSPLQPPYDGPYLVVRRQGKSYVICINGNERTVSLDRLKPAHSETPSDQAPAEVTNPTLAPAAHGILTHYRHHVSLALADISVGHNDFTITLRSSLH